MSIRTKLSTALVKTGVNILKKSSVPASTWFTKVLSLANWEDGSISSGGVDAAYRVNPWVNIAVNKIAKNFTRTQFKIIQGEDEEIKEGPIWDLFINVNPQMSRSQLWYATIAWRNFRGESIWTFEADFDGINMPEEIYVHDPLSFVEVLNQEGTKIVMWKYYTPGGSMIPILPSEVIHMAKWNPINEFRGVNPLIAHEALLNQDFLADQFNLYLLRNRSTPAGLLTTEEPLNEDQALEYIERWEKEHRGASRTARISVLGNKLQYQKIGLTPAEMEFLDMKRWNRSAVMAAYGVTPAVAGYKDEASALSGSDTKEQNVQFWTQAILPEKAELEDKLITEFSNRWASNVRFLFDVSEIPELQEDIEKLRIQDRKDVTAGIKLINEVRAERKLEDVSWGDTWWKGFALVDVTASSPEPAPSKPSPKLEESKPKKQIESHTPLTVFDRKEKELGIFEPQSQPTYPEEVKNILWQDMKGRVQDAENNLKKSMDLWLFEQRSEILADTIANSTGSLDWEFQAQKLADKIKPTVEQIVGTSYISLEELYGVLGMQEYTRMKIGSDFIQNSCERIASLSWKMKKIIENIPRTSAEDLRSVYREAQNKMKPLAQLETGRVFNEVRMADFQLQGFSEHLWLSDPSAKNIMDGEVVKIGSPFSNGQVLPIDLEKNEMNFSLPVILIKRDGRSRASRVYLQVQAEMAPFEAVIIKIVADFWRHNKGKTLGIIKTAANVRIMEDFVRSALWDSELNRSIMKPMKRTFSKGRKRSFIKAKVPYSPDPTKPAAFLAQRGVKVSYHVEGIKRILLDTFAVNREVPIKEIADKISKDFSMAEFRAKRIARTEVTAAFNGGMLEGMVETGQKLKQWIHSGDILVRPSHWIDEVVPVKEFFTLADGYKVMYPGDGDAAHSINCRCTLQSIEIENDEG